MIVFISVIFFLGSVSSTSAQSPVLHNDLSMEDFFTDFSKLVSDILIKIKVKHCYAVITDEIYANILTENIFAKMTNHPVFLVSDIKTLFNFFTDEFCFGDYRNK